VITSRTFWTTGSNASQIVFFIFSRCAFTTCNLSAIVNWSSHVSASSFFHCFTTAFTSACFFSASVSSEAVFHKDFAYSSCASV
jgi:hypothetical protein